jgi:hypothetical protein
VNVEPFEQRPMKSIKILKQELEKIKALPNVGPRIYSRCLRLLGEVMGLQMQDEETGVMTKFMKLKRGELSPAAQEYVLRNLDVKFSSEINMDLFVSVLVQYPQFGFTYTGDGDYRSRISNVLTCNPNIKYRQEAGRYILPGPISLIIIARPS